VQVLGRDALRHQELTDGIARPSCHHRGLARGIFWLTLSSLALETLNDIAALIRIIVR
jgi:hypothetical protein